MPPCLGTFVGASLSGAAQGLPPAMVTGLGRCELLPALRGSPTLLTGPFAGCACTSFAAPGGSLSTAFPVTRPGQRILLYLIDKAQLRLLILSYHGGASLSKPGLG